MVKLTRDVPAEPNPINKQIELLMRGSRVSRFHTTPTIKEETVGHHTSIVCGILLLVWPERVTVDLLRYAVFHDSAEFITGDVPSPAKRLMDRSALDALESSVMVQHNVPLQTLDEGTKRIFKFADNLAGIATCVFELRMGNLHAVEAYRNFTTYFRDAYVRDRDGFKVWEAYTAIIRQLPEHILKEVNNA